MTLNLSKEDILMIYCALTDEVNMAYENGKNEQMKDWQAIQDRIDAQLKGDLDYGKLEK